MKRLIAIIFICIGLISCNSDKITLSSLFNSIKVNESMIKIDNDLDTSLNLSESRNLIFFLDTQCSVCISEFIKFMKKNEDFKYDSLLIVAQEAYDFIQPQFFLEKSNLSLPKNSRIIFDPKNKIYSIMLNSYGNQNLLLAENKKILAKVNTQYLIYTSDNGYTLDKNQIIKK
ncbi:MAG: hypothetical protein MJ211_01630 [Bacteroidales bacterium]|nr:hypothetical protein [Bacteroidales bacterium]